MGKCSVIGCKTKFKKKGEGGKRLYRYPRSASDEKRRYYWARFTRRGSKFVPKESSLICEDHFEQKYFVNRKDRGCLTKDSVPTIYCKSLDDGSIEQIIVPFNGNLDDYCQDSEDDQQADEDPDEVLAKNQARLEEIKNTVCRFCAQIKKVTVEVEKFENYNVEIASFMRIMELNRDYDVYLSKVVCEECFYQIVTLETFRVKSKEAERLLVRELKQLDPEFKSEVKGYEMIAAEATENMDNLDDYSYQDNNDDDDMKNDLQEEYLETYESYEQMSDSEQYDESYGPIKVSYTTDQIASQIPIGEIENHQIVPATIEIKMESDDKKPKKKWKYKKEIVERTDVYEGPADGGIITNPERNRIVLQVYNCVYCKKNFGGRKTYRAHICDRKEIKCEECEKTFKKLRSYKLHKVREHESEKNTKHYCPMCKSVIVGSNSKFKIHRRRCNKERDKPIECELCGRKCETLTGYTVHKLFHDASKNEKIQLKDSKDRSLKPEKEEWICEQCGKVFKSISGYQCHILTIHTISDRIWQCEICSKICANKLALKDHKRNTHKVQESPCNICGKVFRTKVLLKKHMMYHDESKRIFKCQFCPDKPGYFTNVALKRHQRSHNGERPYHCDFCGTAYSTSTQLKYHMGKSHPNVMTIQNVQPASTNLTITGI